MKRAIEAHNAAIDMAQDSAKDPLAVQMAHLAADAADTLPPLIHLYGWVFFSAVSSLTGNMGQTNYSAANMVLDALTFNKRQTDATQSFYPVALMWGAIADIGMRLKAFGSQDFLALSDNAHDVLMTPLEAKNCLEYIINGISPEWIAAWK